MKLILRGMATLAVMPLLISHWVCRVFSTPDQSLESHSQFLALFPGRTGNYLRGAFYRQTLDHFAPTATLCFGTLLSKTGAQIHEHVYVGPRCNLGLVTLERDVLLGPSVQIPSGPHTHGITRLDQPIRTQPGQPQRITVGCDSWIGASSIVLADVGEQSVVGAGSIVTKPIPPRSLAVGNPARALSERPQSEQC